MGGCAGTPQKQPNKPQQPFTPIYNTKPANNNVQPVRQSNPNPTNAAMPSQPADDPDADIALFVPLKSKEPIKNPRKM
jgi:hypothetical protein